MYPAPSFFLFEELNSIRPALELKEIADVSSKKADDSLAGYNSITDNLKHPLMGM